MLDVHRGLNLLARRLGGLSALEPDDIAAIRGLVGTVQTLEPSEYLVREGERPVICAILLSGYAFRQKLTREGARQIVGLRIPGDALDLQSLYLEQTDHNIQALTRASTLCVPIRDVRALVEKRPAIARAIMFDMLTEASMTREALLNVGRRDARTRLAHLLCEFAARLDDQGLTTDGGYDLPMTQEQLGDALGLTSVHVNRTLKGLEAEGALTREGRRIRFTDRKLMRQIADFSTLYLHLNEDSPAR